MGYKEDAHRQAHANTRKDGRIEDLEYLEALTVVRESRAAKYPDNHAFPRVVRVLSYTYTP